MASSKYGRLFTEVDMIEAVWRAWQLGAAGECAEERRDVVAERVMARMQETDGLTFPADEPLFLLRGQDGVASTAVGAYLRECSLRGSSLDHTNAVERAYDEMTQFVADYPERVKVPD